MEDMRLDLDFRLRAMLSLGSSSSYCRSLVKDFFSTAGLLCASLLEDIIRLGSNEMVALDVCPALPMSQT